MTVFEIWAAIIAVSLTIGVVLGVLIVIALPQIRYYRNARRYLDHGGWDELPPPEDDEKPPWWQDG